MQPYLCRQNQKQKIVKVMIYEKPSHVLKELYILLSSEKSWQKYFIRNEISKRDNFVRRYCTGLYDYIAELGVSGYSMEDAYEYVLSEASDDTHNKLTPNLDEFKRILNFSPAFTKVCEEYYNNPQNEPVISLLNYLYENISLIVFECRYIPKMYRTLNPDTTRFIYPLYVSRAILDEVIFESFVDDYKGQNLQQKALPVLLCGSLGIQYSHCLEEGYREYISQMYKDKPIRRYVDRLALAIFHNRGLSDRDKKALIRKIDTLDEKRCKLYGEELPTKTYHDALYPKGSTRPYVKLISTPMGGQNKRY